VSASCDRPLSLDELVAYERGEPFEAEASVEGHLFACVSCTERLEWLHRFEDSVVVAMRRGLFDVFVTTRTIERLERAGSVVRKYELSLGDSVNCTIAPSDDMTVITLHTPPRAGVPVALVVTILDHASGHEMRELHPAFQDPTSGDVVIRLAGVIQKALGRVRVTLELRFGDGDGADAETAGPFEMNHSPWTE
jgi:hypothetical protein